MTNGDTNPPGGESPGRTGERSAPIDLPAEEFRAAGYALIDRLTEVLRGIRERPVTGGLAVGDIRRLIDADAPMPDEGAPAGELLAEAAEVLTRHSLYNGHPRFLGYVTSSPAPIGMLADLLAAAVNPNVGAWTLSPVASEIEAQTIRWIAGLLGFPAGCSGLLVSGGNVANHVGIYTALRSVFPRDSGGLPPERLGRATVYATVETHTWIEKAMDMFGFAPGARRSVGVDAAQRLDVDDLRARLAADVRAGLLPVAVVGNAGTVSTGAVDPLPAIAAVCREHGVWFHVDGAYGGFAAMLADASEDLRGLSLADSVAVDPHKWLYTPLEAGCALVRDPVRHRAAYSYHPPYYHFDEEATNYVDYGPQNSRGFRALKVWLGLRQAGRRGCAGMIAEDIALARRLSERLQRERCYRVFTHNLSIVTFQYVPEGCLDQVGQPATEAYLNRLNQALQERLETSGELFVSNAVIDGRHALRACIVNFRTSASDIDAIPGIISRHGDRLHATLDRQP
ncbi:MAG: aspartate aminotransferase family protein [Verrucomicrobiales bacterium]|nr:aspartate aminotransferase family protein [Verrucomicrobiales bacterium]MCP5525228.1 aspartate aminotransferase family protein [Verrucomicrobiales bacterium]